MEKIITIGGKEVKLSNNVAWTMEYKDQFNKDVLEALMPVVSTLVETVTTIISETGKTEINLPEIADALQGRTFELTLPLMQLGFTDTIVNAVWAMAKAADSSIAPPKQWVRQFDEFPLDVIVPEVGWLILKGFASSKNLERLREIGESLKQTQPKKKKAKSTSKQ